MMKREEFIVPEIEVVKFSENDAILTASNLTGRDPIELPEL